MKVALYARYSSDIQRDTSIADQFRLCRLFAEGRGWSIQEEYSDHAITGSTLLLRPGLQRVMQDAMQHRFDVLLAESLDRFSRDQEDTAGLFKRLRFLGVSLVTLGEGEITELHVGFKGTMNALYLKDLADKTRRGLPRAHRSREVWRRALLWVSRGARHSARRREDGRARN